MNRWGGPVLLVVLLVPAEAAAHFPFPAPPPPEEYGNLLIWRGIVNNGMKEGLPPVSFSHWIHRRKHTCRVCHFELQFNMEANTTEITESANRSGMYCGACHDGKELFGHEKKEDCEKCHNGDLTRSSKRFGELWKFPKTRYGNQIDWVAAREEGWIKPAHKLSVDPTEQIGFDNTLDLAADWSMVPGAIFPHGKHAAWLDCNDCHPYLFNIKKKFTEGFRMTRNLHREYCGVCHTTVAFPMTDCKRCHPTLKAVPDYQEPVPR